MSRLSLIVLLSLRIVDDVAVVVGVVVDVVVVFAVVVVVVLAPFSALFFVANVFIGASFLPQACYTQATIQPCRCNFSFKLI